jgi:hypothetical protein
MWGKGMVGETGNCIWMEESGSFGVLAVEIKYIWEQ